MIAILRLGHRIKRDERVSTHCALVSRALGASEMVYCGQKDAKFEDSINSVSEKWGGEFKIRFADNWKEFLREWNGKVVYLTMYGVNLPDVSSEIRTIKDDVLVVVGSEKVPPEIYEFVDYQVAITNQPHSEIGALAIFLDWFFDHKLNKEFEGEIKIKPKIKGKEFEK